MHATYRELLARCPQAPYNLLATRRWMLVVPRRQERYEKISVNALGFAGSLFVTQRRGARARAPRRPMLRASAMTMISGPAFRSSRIGNQPAGLTVREPSRMYRCHLRHSGRRSHQRRSGHELELRGVAYEQ